MSPLLLLHGALGSAALFDPLQASLAASFTTHTLSFSGHGGQPFAPAGFGIAQFAQETLDYLDAQGLEKVDVLGYSMGGYVALYLALNHPDRVGKIYTLATKFAWSPEAAAAEAKMLNPEAIEAKVPKFAHALEARHGESWKPLLQATAQMMQDLGANPLLTSEQLAKISHTCRITVGDQDQMVTQEETQKAAEALPNGSFALMENTPHPLEKVDTEQLARLVANFMA